MLEVRTFDNALNDEAGIEVTIPDDFKFNRYADAFELLPDEATGWRE